MMCYAIEIRHQIFVKDFGFLSFAKNMSKNISKNLSSKYSQKLLITLNNMLQMHLNLL